MFAITHRKAIVTGAASGIGKAIAEQLVQAGAHVVGLDRNEPAGLTFPLVKADLCIESEIITAVETAAEILHGIDLLINSAGIEIDESLDQLTVESLDRMYQLNVRGLMLVTREVVRKMPAAGEDVLRIINIASELGFLGRAGASGYCGTKGAVIAITRSWARELGARARVNAVAPGPIDTPLLNFSAMSVEQRNLECGNPLSRIGQPHEVAAVACFLSSAAASFVTGQCYGVDGGAAMR